MAGGSLHDAAEEGMALRVITDSRQLREGDLFVALRGDRFDGHDFAAQALASGAAAVLVEKGTLQEGARIEVEDTLVGLQTLAGSHRAIMPALRTVITGSNGKTSTKDMAAMVMSQRFRTIKTEGNLNNHIGLPLSLLALNVEDEAGVFEIGMNHRGEIAPLARLAAPQIAIITNIGVAHIENLGSRENIALEKGDLAAALPPDGILVLNSDDPFSVSIAERTDARTIMTGIQSGELRAHDLTSDGRITHFRMEWEGGHVEVNLPVPGKHMVHNALLAAGAGLAAGLSLDECAAGLAAVALSKGRLQIRAVDGYTVLDDSYNANPDSMIAALRTLAEFPTTGKRIAALGRMGELGSHAEEGHRRVGRAMGQATPDLFIALGEEGRWIAEEAQAAGVATETVESLEQAADLLSRHLEEGDVLLIKASRAVGMEKLLPLLEARNSSAT